MAMASQKHTPYAKRSGRKWDFVVSYQLLLDPRLAGMESLRQGQKTDFCYEEDYTGNHGMTVYRIRPEFIGTDGQVILDMSAKIPESGLATMWILNSELRGLHRERLKVGSTGFMVVGPYRIARVVVKNLSGLLQDA
jgi:hypothetical protein